MNDLLKLFNVELNQKSTYELVQELTNEGVSQRDIASIAGVSRSLIYYILHSADRFKKHLCHTGIINAYNYYKRGNSYDSKQ